MSRCHKLHKIVAPRCPAIVVVWIFSFSCYWCCWLWLLLLITGFLCTGDEILSVNGRCVQGLSHEEAIAEFRKVADRWLSLNSSFLTFNLANIWLCIYWSNLRKFGQQMALQCIHVVKLGKVGQKMALLWFHAIKLEKFGQQMALHSCFQTWKSWPKDGSALHSCYQTWEIWPTDGSALGWSVEFFFDQTEQGK